MKSIVATAVGVLALLQPETGGRIVVACNSTVVVVAPDAHPQERLAAAELRRAVYASTGALCELQPTLVDR